MSGKKKEMSIDEAKLMVQAAERQKIEAFITGYKALCEKHGMEFQPLPVQLQVVLRNQ